MFEIITSLKSTAPLSFGTASQSEKGANESHDAYDKRVFRERCHTNAAGKIIIPGIMFRHAIVFASQMRGEKIKGRMNATYTKHFESGVRVTNDIELPLTPAECPFEDVFCYAQGHKKPDEPRVWRRFLRIESWAGDVVWQVWDADITPAVFIKTLRVAGYQCGLGRWAYRAGGMYGGFEVVNYVVSDERLMDGDETFAAEEKAAASVAGGEKPGKKGKK